MEQVEGNIVDVINRRIFPGSVFIENGVIKCIVENTKHYDCYIAPGFVDAHVHIESSMLLPLEFSKLVIKKGTVAIVNDPHEIANVLGVEGIDYMAAGSGYAFIKNFFTIPSCVPATPFDCSGSRISAEDVEALLSTKFFIGLSEVMNVPGVLNKDAELLQKIESVCKCGLVIDGHAPGLRGEELKTYIQAGITTDHECTDLEEALEKIASGMKILIREGSAAKNYEALKSLIGTHPEAIMFCTDDSHPHDLIEDGHIDKIVKKALSDGFDLFDVLQIASINPIKHYNLNVGMLREGDPADFVIYDSLEDFSVSSVYIEGVLKLNKGKLVFPPERYYIACLNKFARKEITKQEIEKIVSHEIVCIGVTDGELITENQTYMISETPFNLQSDIERDILKIVYINRYENNPPQVAYINGINLKRGAFATTISHDSHNIIAVGCSDEEIVSAVNCVIKEKGGLSIADSGKMNIMPLPIAGIISNKTGAQVAAKWKEMIAELKGMGCTLDSPFMTLSFMALIVIPELKIGERGLFEYSKFNFIS